MKKLSAFFVAVLFSVLTFAQNDSGTIVMKYIQSTYLTNAGGENTSRRISVYLPPSYDRSNLHYPVIYYMHGFMGNDTISPRMRDILDRGIATKKIRPFLLVIADNRTSYSGSFYSNSTLIGDMESFQTKELVSYMDKNFRTIPRKEARGLGGHSMGGYGVLKIGMMYPDVFISLYALSPGLLAFVKEYGPNSDTYRQLSKIETKEELDKTYYPRVMVACARAWSPNPDKPPFYVDVPFNYVGDSLVIDKMVYEKWRVNMPLYMIDKYADNLKKLKAIKLDWGRNDASRFHVQCLMFSQELENHGIEHFAEEYIGTHVNKIWTPDGRVLNEMLPFFNDYLEFDG